MAKKKETTKTTKKEKQQVKLEEVKLDVVKPSDELPPIEIEVIDNKKQPISNDTRGDIPIPKGFAPLPKKKNKGTMGNYKGRIYKVLDDYRGVWCDSGTLFPLSELK